MSNITITEVIGERPNQDVLEQYTQRLEVDGDRSAHEIWIEWVADNGDSFFLPVAAARWRDFVRTCQSLSTSF